jgi:ATP-dependent RNA helicase RhlE
VAFGDLKLTTPLNNALDELGITNPTPIQESSFNVILSGRDMVGIAQTGTGKTFAYLLPILKTLPFTKQKHPRVLIVVPTRELVVQVVAEAEKLTKYMSVRTMGVFGGTNINTQKQVVFDGMDILVATPGRLVDLVLDGIIRLKSVQKFVIDEVDEMLNLGFRPQLVTILDNLPQRRQNLMFSATLTDDVAAVINDFFYTPEIIGAENKATPLVQIAQFYYAVPNFLTKVDLLKLLLSDVDTYNRVLVFVSGKQVADRLFDELNTMFPDQIGVIHSNKSQNNRVRTIRQFIDGEFRILLGTDIASRGLDIPDITHVFNFDAPEMPEDYMHRMGRTGRNEKTGTVISFVNEAEQEAINEVELFTAKIIEQLPLPDGLEISDVYSDEERPVLFDKDYLGEVTRKEKPTGGFHDKKEKNKKVNLGGPGKRKPRKTKPANRGVLKKRASKRKNS